MDIIFIAENENGQQETITIPVVQGIEPINCETTDEEFQTIDGFVLNLIGGKGLRNFSFSSFFPSKKYNFISWLKYRDPQEYIDYLEKYRDLKIPIRIIVVDRYKVVLNMLCRYNFTYALRDKAGDIPYTLEIKEYILPIQRSDNNV